MKDVIVFPLELEKDLNKEIEEHKLKNDIPTKQKTIISLIKRGLRK